jgi:hypothetical protein
MQKWREKEREREKQCENKRRINRSRQPILISRKDIKERNKIPL